MARAHYRLLLLCLLVWMISLPFSAFADTLVDADVLEDTTWTKAGSPYLIQTGITIYPNTTLSIESGVVVRVVSGGITIFGGLHAHGTSDEPIIVTSSAQWGGLQFFDANTGSSLDYAIIQNAREVGAYRSSGLVITHTRIENGYSGFGCAARAP